MNNNLFEKIKAGLIEAIEYEKGNTHATVHPLTISPPVMIKNLNI
jgi:hypothetical protein